MPGLARLVAYRGRIPKIDDSFFDKDVSIIGSRTSKKAIDINKEMDFAFENAFRYAKKELGLGKDSNYLLIQRTSSSSGDNLDLEAIRLAEHFLKNGVERIIVIDYPIKESVDNCLYDSKRENRVREGYDSVLVKVMARYRPGLEYFLE